MSLFLDQCTSLSLSFSRLALDLSWALFNFTIYVNVIKISFVKAPKSPPGQGESHSVALVDHRETMFVLLLLLLPLPDTVHFTRAFAYGAMEKPKHRSREFEPERQAQKGCSCRSCCTSTLRPVNVCLFVALTARTASLTFWTGQVQQSRRTQTAYCQKHAARANKQTNKQAYTRHDACEIQWKCGREKCIIKVKRAAGGP